jgi:hypothetical protein
MTFPGTDSKPAGLLFSPASAERRHHCNDHDFHRLAAKPARHRSRAAGRDTRTRLANLPRGDYIAISITYVFAVLFRPARQ